MSKKIKFSEVYEKYMFAKTPDGKIIKPKLTDTERKIYDLAYELDIAAYIKVGGRRSGFRYEVNPIIKKIQ